MAFYMKKRGTGLHTRYVVDKKTGKRVRHSVQDGEVIECSFEDLKAGKDKFIEVPNPKSVSAKFGLDVVETSAESGEFNVVRTDTGRVINDRPLSESEAHELVRTVYDAVLDGIASPQPRAKKGGGGSVTKLNDGQPQGAGDEGKKAEEPASGAKA